MVRLLLVSWLAGLPALGCPVCDTATGAQVRDGIFNQGFAGNLLAALAPFAVLALAVGGFAFLGPRRKSPPAGSEEPRRR